MKAACTVSLQNNIEEAHNILDDILIKEPENAFALYVKGLVFLEQKNFHQVLDFFNKAIEDDGTGDMQKAST